MSCYGGPRMNIATTFGLEKQEWQVYQMVKKVRQCFFISIQYMGVTDG